MLNWVNSERRRRHLRHISTVPVALESGSNDDIIELETPIPIETESSSIQISRRPRLVPLKRAVGKFNFVASMASNIHRNVASPLEYEIFRSGAEILNVVPEEIQPIYSQIRLAVMAGFENRSDQDLLLQEYRDSMRPVAKGDPADIRLMSIRELLKEINPASKMVEDLGGDVLFSMSFREANSVSVYPSRYLPTFNKFLENTSGMEIEDFTRYIAKSPASIQRTIDICRTEKVEYIALNVSEKRRWIHKTLLNIYRRNCSLPHASKINWSLVNVLGWPDSISPNLTNQSRENLDKIHDAILNGSVVFELLPSTT